MYSHQFRANQQTWSNFTNRTSRNSRHLNDGRLGARICRGRHKADCRIAGHSLQPSKTVQRSSVFPKRARHKLWSPKAKQTHLNARRREEFAVVASEVAEQTANNIGLGEIAKQDLPDDLAIESQVSSRTVSMPIRGPFGWHIFKVEQINVGRKATLEDVRERLNLELAREKAVDDVYKAANNLKTQLARARFRECSRQIRS